MKNLLAFSLATSTLLIAATEVRAATFIDSFDRGTVNLEVFNKDGNIQATDSDHSLSDEILGGRRDVYLEFDPQGNEGEATVRTDINGNMSIGSGTNDFRHNNEAEVNSVANLVYNAGGVGLGNGSGINLLDLGDHVSLEVDVESVDLKANLEVALTDMTGNISSVSQDDLSVGTVDFQFTDFTGIDLTSITEISLKSTSVDSADLVLDSLRIDGKNPPPTTPEPATVFGLLLSFLGCSALSKKSKSA
jgi:hypothetical protein